MMGEGGDEIVEHVCRTNVFFSSPMEDMKEKAVYFRDYRYNRLIYIHA